MSRIIALGVCGFASLIALRAQELPGVQAPAFRSRTGQLMAFVRAYQGRATSATGVEVISRVVDERDRHVRFAVY